MNHDFLPTTPEELAELGWDKLDVIIVSGDSYIDSPFIGAAVIGRVLESAGFRVGIIAQPDITSSAGYYPPGRAAPVLGCHRRQRGFDGCQSHRQQEKAPHG